jgi:ligand-binding sensor domain-containing protein
MRHPLATVVGTAILLLLSCPCAAQVWARPAPALALAGAEDVLAAATSGGVLLWHLPSGRIEHVTTLRGLPTQVTLATLFAPARDEVWVATDNGLSRGWFDGRWTSLGAQPDEKGSAWFAATARRHGGWIAGGERGQLVAWHHDRVDSLRVPTRAGRVVGLALPTLRAKATRKSARGTQANVASTPPFPAGLTAALDNDGVWIVRLTSTATRWLRFGEMEGLPSRYTRDVLIDSSNRIWVATHLGLACIENDEVHTFEDDPLLAQRANALLAAPDGFLYVALQDGLAKLEIGRSGARAMRIPETTRPVIALAWAGSDVWWSDGDSVCALAGRCVELPRSLAANSCLALTSSRDTLWVGHPSGFLSTFSGSTWSRLDSANALPIADVRSVQRVGDFIYVGTDAGLFRRRHGTDGRTRFERIEGPETACAQTADNGRHWVGGPSGLWVRNVDSWSRVALWAGDAEVVDLLAANDTLWVSAGHAGVAYRSGSRWVLPACDSEASWFGRLSRSRNGRLAVASDRGVLLGDGRGLQHLPGLDELVTALRWWGSALACGTFRGLWIHDVRGTWERLGVLDGLPGAQVRALDTDAEGHLWIGTSRGLGRLPASDTVSDSRGVAEPNAAPGRTRRIAGDEVRFAGVTRVRIYDVRGRLVRALAAASAHGVSWNTHSTDGARVANGIYFAHMIGSRRVDRILLQR